MRASIAALKADPSAALKAFNDEKNKEFRDRDLFVYCFDLPDGNFTAYQSSLMLGTNVRELKLDKDPIGQRAYDVVAREPEGEFVSIEYNFPRSGTKQPATKESLETRMGNQACGVSYFQVVSSRRTASLLVSPASSRKAVSSASTRMTRTSNEKFSMYRSTNFCRCSSSAA